MSSQSTSRMLKYALISNFKLKFEFNIHSVDVAASTINQGIELRPLNLYNLHIVAKRYTFEALSSNF